ncbi:MAG: hypothetical protein K0S41_3689 [Anaerocolumna sp.]|jgi:hypothetical protein|nr:hypothetical protein [Anaerocolumna sp.]
MSRKCTFKACDLYDGETTLLDGTKITIENSIIRKINDADVYGLRDIMLNQCDIAEIRKSDSDVLVITTDTRVFGNIEDVEKEWSKDIGKQVVLMPYYYETHNIFTQMFDKLNKIEKELETIKNEKEIN